MDAFTQDWLSKNDWLVLASTLVSRVLSHMCDCKAVGSLIVHMWKSTYFRPLLCSDNVHLNFFEREWLFLSNESDLFTRGKVMDKLLGTKALELRCFALRIVFPGNNCCSSLSFCTSRNSYCSACQSGVP